MEQILASKIDLFVTVILDAITCYVIALLGAIAKDVLIDTAYRNKPRIDIRQVLTGSFLGTLITLAARNYIDVYMFPLMAFIVGAMGYELFTMAATVDGMMNVIQKVRIILSNIFIVRDGLEGKPTAQSNFQFNNYDSSRKKQQTPLGQNNNSSGDTQIQQVPKKERE